MVEIARVENRWKGDKVGFIGLTVFAEGALEVGGTAAKAGGHCGEHWLAKRRKCP